MAQPIEIQVVETYKGIPILEVSHQQSTLLSAETHGEQLEALLRYPAERMAVIISYNNLTCSGQYGAKEQAKLYESEEFAELGTRAVCILRYHARSLTALVETMSAHALMAAGPSNFAPDLETAVRAARRTIEQLVKEETLEQQPETQV